MFPFPKLCHSGRQIPTGNSPCADFLHSKQLALPWCQARASNRVTPGSFRRLDLEQVCKSANDLLVSIVELAHNGSPGVGAWLRSWSRSNKPALSARMADESNGLMLRLGIHGIRRHFIAGEQPGSQSRGWNSTLSCRTDTRSRSTPPTFVQACHEPSKYCVSRQNPGPRNAARCSVQAVPNSNIQPNRGTGCSTSQSRKTNCIVASQG